MYHDTKTMATFRTVWLIAGLLGFATLLPAQDQIEADTTGGGQVTVDHADLFEYLVMGDSAFQRLIGNVELRHDSMYMYCDSAVIFNETQVVAQGQVIIQQGDSLSIFSDSLFYDGDLKMADLYGEVILVNQDQKLFTTELNYDLDQRIATYQHGALLTNDTTQLTSKRGYYYVRERQVYFKDSVQIVDTNFELKTDTLEYDTQTKVATFLAPTLITQNESRIYCESGFYDIDQQLAVFRQNAQYAKGDTTRATAHEIRYDGLDKVVTLDGKARFEENDKLATAEVIRYYEEDEITILEGRANYVQGEKAIQSDTIVYNQKSNSYATRGRSVVSDPPQLMEANWIDYDRESGVGLALGEVIWRDTSDNLTIFCARADYDEATDYLRAAGGRQGRPLLLTLIDEDSLYLAADTLVAFREDSLAQDSLRTLLAYHDVRIFKEDLQGICDSLVYRAADSMFRLFRQPVLWSDTSQFNADTVHIQMANDRIDRILFYNQAFMVNTPDEEFFNQVKGRFVVAFFREGKIDRMRVSGNAESIYYALDDEDAYLGVNKTVCSEMRLAFQDGKVQEIRFYNEPKAQFIPFRQADHEALRLPGFFWEVQRRPRSLEDLFSGRSAEMGEK